MRIVFLNTTGQIGGAERSLLDFMASLRQAQPAWPLSLVNGNSGPFVEACDGIGVPVCVERLPEELARLGDAGAGGPAGRELSKAVLLGRLALASAAALRYTRNLRRTLEELKPDLIHTNGFKMHVLGAWAKPTGVPLVWHIHDYVSSRVVMAKLLRMFAGRCTAAIANSASVAEDLQSVLNLRMPLHEVWNGVDLNEFSPDGPELDLDALSGLAPAGRGVVRVGLVGTLAKWKGHDVFLRALSMLPAKLPVRGYIVGGPLYQTDASQWRLADLKQQAAQLGLAGRVGFTGFVRRSAEAMRSLDVVVHASTKPEPFGLVIIEAMACRRALIASRGGGANEIIRDGVNALAHTPGHAEDLAGLIVRLAHDPKLREKLGEAGRQTAERHFDRARLGLELAPIYQSIMSARPAEAA
ncbi:MAG: glycosyl transferase family 1 [Acidobacteria bacterium]|nr:MAG: glycosyl transferase family 1 [Acidobacteriota bacterium]